MSTRSNTRNIRKASVFSIVFLLKNNETVAYPHTTHRIKKSTSRISSIGKAIPARYMVAIMCSVGMGIIYGLKVNLHVNIVSMVNHTAIRDKRLEERSFSVCAADSKDNSTDVVEVISSSKLLQKIYKVGQPTNRHLVTSPRLI